MPTKRTVSDIKSKLLNPALTSHFEVEIFKPTGSTGYSFEKFLSDNGLTYETVEQERLQLMCSEASLPGSSLATHELNNDFTGVTERHAYRRLYDDRIDLTFYVDAEKYYTIMFFELWIKFIVNESVNQSSTGKPGSPNVNYSYRMKYISEYASTMKIVKFERDYQATLDYNFVNVFPISITSMPVSYDSSSLLKCTVSMSYVRYWIDQTPKGEPATVQSPNQQAEFNASQLAFDPNLYTRDLGLDYGNFTTTGGNSFSSAFNSGKTIDVTTAFGSGITLNK